MEEEMLEHRSASAEYGGDKVLAAVDPADISRQTIVCGDPGRVTLTASLLDQPVIYDLPRGFRLAAGTFDGQRITVMSHGIGGPSLEGVLVALARRGVKTVIRVGTTGSLRADVQCGDLIVNEAAVRLDGTSDQYVLASYPAAASHEVTGALVSAAAALGSPVHVGVGATCASFFNGQGRESFNGYKGAFAADIHRQMVDAGVLNFEMECATLLVLGRLFGLRCGAILTVVANRATGTWEEADSQAACEVACRALVTIASMSRPDHVLP